MERWSCDTICRASSHVTNKSWARVSGPHGVEAFSVCSALIVFKRQYRTKLWACSTFATSIRALGFW